MSARGARRVRTTSVYKVYARSGRAFGAAGIADISYTAPRTRLSSSVEYEAGSAPPFNSTLTGTNVVHYIMICILTDAEDRTA